MSLVRRRPKRTKPLAYFTEKYGLSAETLKRLARENGWPLITYTDSDNSPKHLYEHTVDEYISRRQQQAHV